MKMLPNFTKRQWLTLIIIGLADFANAICVSLQAPFFPHEAEKKGCTATEYGFVFGIFELIVFLVSPLYGQFMNRIGPKVLFNSGIYTTGTSAIIFGLLDKVEGRILFITLALIIRIVEALGNAAFLTASFAIIAKEFPNNVSVTFASLETFFGLGLIVGPMVGGFLYSIGGYYLPFVTLGLLLFLTAVITMGILPTHDNTIENGQSTSSILTLLKIPQIMVCALSIMATSASIGFLGATLEPHLRGFNLTPVITGVVFVINGGFYALSAPMWGCMVDKSLNPKISALFGSLLIAVAFCFIGPASFIPVDPTLGVIITGLVCHGFGIAAVLVSSFSDALKTAIRQGMPDSIDTYGLVSGLWTSTFALGAFFGPTISGILFDSIGFRKAVIFIIVLHLIVAGIVSCSILCQRTPHPYKELDASQPLLKNCDGFLHRDRSSLNGTNDFNASIEEVTPTAFNNLMVSCNSFNHKHCQSWSSRCEQDTKHTQRPCYYGSCVEEMSQRHVGPLERETIA